MNSKSLSALRSIQKQLSEDYLQFFEGLRAAYPPNSDIYRRTDSVISRIKRALRLFGRMMGAGGTSATQAELNELTKEVDAINKEKDALAKIARKDNELADKISAVESKTGISESDLSVSSSALEGAVEDRTSELKRQAKEAKRGSLLDQYQRALAGFYVMHGTFSPVLGPYAGAVTGILQSPIVARTLWEGVKAPFSYVRGMFGGNDISSLGGGEDFGISPITSSAAASGYSGGFSISRGLFDFFNKPAFDAKWTKELLRAVTDKAKSDDSVKVGELTGGLGGLVSRAGGGFLTTATSKAWPFLKAAGLLLGKVGAWSAVALASKKFFDEAGKALGRADEIQKAKKEQDDINARLSQENQSLLNKAVSKLGTVEEPWARRTLGMLAGISDERDLKKYSNEQIASRARTGVNIQQKIELSRQQMNEAGGLSKYLFDTFDFWQSAGTPNTPYDRMKMRGSVLLGVDIFKAVVDDFDEHLRKQRDAALAPFKSLADGIILSQRKASDVDIKPDLDISIEEAARQVVGEVVDKLDNIEKAIKSNRAPSQSSGWQGPSGGITRELEQLNKGYIGTREGIN
jgi:hypothetical protein